jgi:hypothetical protein
VSNHRGHSVAVGDEVARRPMRLAGWAQQQPAVGVESDATARRAAHKTQRSGPGKTRQQRQGEGERRLATGLE